MTCELCEFSPNILSGCYADETMESVVFYFYEITMGLMVPQIAGFLTDQGAFSFTVTI